MKIRKLAKKDIDQTLKILDQKSITYLEKGVPRDWIINFILNRNTYGYGLFVKEELVSVLLAEKITFAGVLLWLIATSKNNKNKGYGSNLLEYFEELVKKEGRKWIFLNSTEEAKGFYKKHKYVTKKHSKVYEHIKDF